MGVSIHKLNSYTDLMVNADSDDADLGDSMSNLARIACPMTRKVSVRQRGQQVARGGCTAIVAHDICALGSPVAARRHFMCNRC